MVLPRMPVAVIFDMDGLLFDTEMLYRDAFALAVAERGYTPRSEIFGQLVGLPLPQSRALLVSHFGEAFPLDEFQAAWTRHFWIIAETRLALKPGVLELLDTLEALGLPRAIATSSSHQTVERHLHVHGLRDRFHAIVARGDYENGKPAPDPFLKAAERLAVDPRSCFALDDLHNGVRSASSAGMLTIMVPDLLEATDEMRGLCTHVAQNLYEVRDIILTVVVDDRRA